MKNNLSSVGRSAAIGCSLAILTASCAGPLASYPLPPETQKSVDRADPQMRVVLDDLHALHARPFTELTPEQARNQPTPADAVKRALADKGLSTDPEPVGAISSISVPGPLGDIPLRIYTPQGNAPFPTLVYFHGGGWVAGSLDSYDASCRALTNIAHCVVISVDYRLAPGHKFPAAPEDAYAATQYVINHAKDFNVDPQHVTVGGESAGANLAAVVCMMARDRAGQMPVYQLLIYPVADYSFDTESYRENANAVPLDRQSMQWFFDKYLSTMGEGTNQYISILRGDVSKLPPATVITAEIDPLRSDGQAYAEKLRGAGVPVKYMNYKGVTHEFFGMGAVVDTAKRAERFAAEGLDSAFAQ